MFTGIIEAVGIVESIEIDGSNRHFHVSSSISKELKIDQSLAHNGVCLTVVSINAAGGGHIVTAIKETLDKSNLGKLEVGSRVNLERCLKIGDRLDGHMVQGHVDTTAVCEKIVVEDGSTVFSFALRESSKGLMVEKGSITINGTSLTLFDVNESHFSVAIIPFTLEHTNFNGLKILDEVNIEFDILGKYIQAQHSV